jgi:hypothetical protein
MENGMVAGSTGRFERSTMARLTVARRRSDGRGLPRPVVGAENNGGARDEWAASVQPQHEELDRATHAAFPSPPDA